MTRAVYAGLLLGALVLTWQEFSRYRQVWAGVPLDESANFAAYFFSVFAWGQLLAVMAVGPALTAGTIAQERERRTLEYLFASNLTNTEIVFGKFAARVLHTAWVLLAGVPVLQIASLMGGIPPEGIVVSFLIAGSTMLTVAAVSIAVSVWAASARSAITTAYLVLFAWLAMPPMMLVFFGNWSNWTAAVELALIAPNPFIALGEALDAPLAGRGGPSGLAITLRLVAAQAVIAALCLAAAMWGLRRVGRNRASGGGRRRRWWWQWKRPAVGNRAMLWKELFAERASNRLGLAGRIAAGVIVLGVVGTSLWEFMDESSFIGFVLVTTTMSTLVGSGALLLAGARAATLVTSEKERDCWTTLLSTDLTGEEIIRAKILGNMYAQRGSAMLMGFLWLLAVVRSPIYLLSAAFVFAAFVVLVWFASALGVGLSLTCRSSMRAMAATVGLMLFVGGGYWFCCFPCLLGGGSGGDEGLIIGMAATMPFLLAFPGMLHDFRSWDSEVVIACLAYGLGLVGYAITANLLSRNAVEMFDQRAGRVVYDVQSQNDRLRALKAARTVGALERPEDFAGVTPPPGSSRWDDD